MQTRSYLLALCALALAPWTVRADGRALEVLTPAGARPPAIEQFKVRATILPGFSVTEVDQVYRNQEDRMLEARYRFPIPWRAAVSGFSLWVNGKEVRGEVVERQKAKQIYESIVNQKQDPGLLEVQDHRYFSLRVYPVPPRGTLRFRISYVQPLDEDAGYVTYVFPLATNAREAGLVAGQFGVTVDLSPGAPVAEAYSTSHRKETAGVRYGEELYRFSLEERDAALDRDFVLVYRLARERTGFRVIAQRAKNGPGYFFCALTPGQELSGPPRPVDYLFLLDCSGSMRHGNLLPAGREAIRWFLDRISPQSRFGLVAFNAMPVVFGDALHAPDAEKRKQAQAWLDGLQARGGTDFLPALRAALELAGKQGDRETAVVVISDGRVSGEEARIERYTAALRGVRGVRVFSLGIGNDVNRPLLEALARQTGGFARYVSSAGDLRLGLVSLKRKIAQPALTGIRVRFEGGQVTGVAPRSLAPVFAGGQLILAGRYGKPGKTQIVVEGTAGGKPRRFAKTVELPAGETRHPEIERGWAAFHVMELLARMRETGPSLEVQQQVTRLGLEYGLVTPFTSYLVLESESEYARHGIGDATRRRVARERTAQQARQQRFEQVRRSQRPQDASTPRATPPASGRTGGGSPTALFLVALTLLCGLGVRRR